MAARFCPSCGKPVSPGATFCGACGAAMPAPGTAPASMYTPSPTGGGSPPAPYTSSGGALPETGYGPRDARAMEWITLAAIFGLISVIAAFVAPYAFGVSLGSVSSRGSVITTVNAIYGLMGVVSVAVVLSMVQFWFFRKGFRTLSDTDPGMQTPATLALLAIVGAILVLAGALWALGQAYSCVSAGQTISRSCLNLGALLGALGLAAVGAIVYLVGVIGIWLGLWRLGTRYNESMFKIGMVLIIFPFLDIVGFILILLSARKARGRALSRRTPTGT